MEINTPNNFVCKICNKTYSSNSGLWKHNKNKHPVENMVTLDITTNSPPKTANSGGKSQNLEILPPESANTDVENNKLQCQYCEFVFTRLDSLKKHNNRCKLKNNETNKIKIELEELKNEYSHLKNKVETLKDQVLVGIEKATLRLTALEKENKLSWAAFKATRVMHLTKTNALSRLNLPIGGGENIINATTENHGPSWRMVVHLTDEIEAWLRNAATTNPD